MAVSMSDGVARDVWGDAYDSIPKAVFALVAWHLANQCSGNGDEDGAATARFTEEIAALADSGIIDAAQAKRILRTFA